MQNLADLRYLCFKDDSTATFGVKEAIAASHLEGYSTSKIMKFSTQEEFGLRLLLRIAKSDAQHDLTIPELSEVEGLSSANTAKILRALRLAGFIDSARGQTGGYKLNQPADKILISNVLTALGGKLYEQDFCSMHAGVENICTNSIDCSIRSVWKTVQNVLDGVLSKFTLQDLLGNEEDVQALALSFAEDLEAKFNKN